MPAYYNEIDPKAAAWLRELIRQGLVADGEVDERSIVDVQPDDLRGFDQCHFFAGIGGWSYALRLAGWRDDRKCWTGSCPCQPFSAAGKGDGADDPRHLWPAWFRLIRKRRPVTVFGEQSASAAGLAWLDLVHADMEAEDYAVGAVDLCAAGVGAPHIRQRLWFVAYTERAGSQGRAIEAVRGAGGGHQGYEPGRGGALLVGPVGDANGRRCEVVGVAQHGDVEGEHRIQPDRSGARGFWDGAIGVRCRDGKLRPVEPGIQPLAHGVSGRVALLRGAGNAIVPQVAAEVIAAYMEIA